MSFAAKLIAWQKRHGRHDLPWQGTRDPYAIWVSEIMLQQTQVATVIPYYTRFMARFPGLAALAAAAPEEVLAHWSGLGYYSRARNLHRAARTLAANGAGSFPRDAEAIARLPGVGRSTAAAVAALAFGARCAILDGNVKRVLARSFGIDGYPGQAKVQRALWAKAEELLPQQVVAVYTQALMDLGATVCTRSRPRCEACPVADRCVALATDRVAHLPSPRPRRELPQKRAQWLILLSQGDVLLEKRPGSGLWGGLWTFPEAQPADDPQRVSAERFGAAADAPRTLTALTHGFSHFRLHITPQVLTVTRRGHRAEEPGAVWMPLHDALDAAVPAPVKRLLEALHAEPGAV